MFKKMREKIAKRIVEKTIEEIYEHSIIIDNAIDQYGYETIDNRIYRYMLHNLRKLSKEDNIRLYKYVDTYMFNKNEGDPLPPLKKRPNSKYYNERCYKCSRDNRCVKQYEGNVASCAMVLNWERHGF